MRSFIARERWPLILVLLNWLVALGFYPFLPEVIPTHWGLDGRPDRWLPRFPGAFISPGVATLLLFAMRSGPKSAPQGAHGRAGVSYPPQLKASFLALLLFITFATLSGITGRVDLDVPRALLAGLGVFFVVLGRVLPQVRPNFGWGVRTPWTLSNDEVWERTHRMTGKVMVVMGALMVPCAWLPPLWAGGVILGGTLGLALVSTGYSYWVYRQVTKGR